VSTDAAVEPDAPESTGGGRADAAPVPDAAAPPPDRAVPDAAPPMPDGPPPPAFPREIDGRLVINEIMASNALTLKNEAGLAGDWIEIFNPTNRDVPLGGYSVTDDFAMPAKAVIASGVVAKAGAHLLLWLDAAADRGPSHLPLRLRAEGGSLALARPDGSFIARIIYGAQETDFSAAREPDGSDHWVIEWHPSPGAANPGGSGRPLAPAAPEAPPEMVPAAGDLSETLLGFYALPQLRIDVSADNLAKLAAAPRTYVPATLVFQGRSYGPVGLHLKGSGSFEPIDKKPSFRINIDEYVADAKFWGLKDLTLNNMHDDPSMMHERLGYWVARLAGLPASRATHALLSLNGEPETLYANVETVKHKMLSRWFKNPDGVLYAATDVDFTTADTLFPDAAGNPRDDIPLYELKSKVDDRTLLYGLARALASGSPDQAMAAAGAYLDVAEFQTFWAFTAVIAQLDGMPYSMPGDDYFVYGNPEDGKLRLLPWGVDETMGADDVDIVDTVYSVLAKTCAASRACRQGFANRCWDILDKVEAMNWVGEHDKIAQQIAPHTRMDHRKPYTDQQVSMLQADMRFFLQARRQTLSKYIAPRGAP
jgi:spore coat protein CotH